MEPTPECPPGAGDPEVYGLTWPGRRRAIEEASLPAAGRLVDDPEHDLGAGPTRNLFVEGDNLDALKCLRDDYRGAVDCIYIDPPYNTGNEFVFADSFVHRAADGEGGGDAPGRAALRHAGWASMMLPRLLVARDLLADGGVGLVSIDDKELAQLRLLLDEVFGPANVLATMIWVSNLKGRQLRHAGPAGTHEYIVCFAKDASRVDQFRGSTQSLIRQMPLVYPRTAHQVKRDARGPYVLKNQLFNTNGRFNERTCPTLVYRIHYHPGTGEVRLTDIDDETVLPGFVTALPHPNARPGLRWHAWRWSRARVLSHADELEFDLSDGTLRIWTKVRDTNTRALKDLIIGPSTQQGAADLARLGLGRVFESPKPVGLIRTLIDAAAGPDALILDFFAGSGTTAQAVWELNGADGGTRRVILVQRAEAVPPDSQAARAGFATIAQITRARVALAAEVLREAGSASDLGMKALRIESFEDAPGE